MVFKEIVLGDLAYGEWAGYIILFLIGATTRFLFSILKRDSKNCARFSWRYFFYANWNKMALVIFVMFGVIRFYSELAPYLIETLPLKGNVTITFSVFLLGLLSQVIINLIYKKLSNYEIKETAEEFMERKNIK